MSPRSTCQRSVTCDGRLAVGGRDLADHVVVEDRALGDRRPCLDEGAVAQRGLAGRLVGEVGVHLDLVDGGHDAGLGDDPVQVLGLEVRDPDRAGPTVLDELGEGPPGRDVVAVVQRRQRPVDQEQVDLLEPQLGQRLVERAPGVVGPVVAVVELAGDPELLAGDVSGLERLADLLLVPVHLRGVDVPVADLERLGDHVGGLRRRDLEDAEAELRDLGLVVQGRWSGRSYLSVTDSRAVHSARGPRRQCPT